jgi:hypothetical protein
VGSVGTANQNFVVQLVLCDVRCSFSDSLDMDDALPFLQMITNNVTNFTRKVKNITVFQVCLPTFVTFHTSAFMG